MQLIDGRPVYSATDLVGFLYCEHLTELERAALVGLVRKPNAPDPELDRIRARGFQHEQRYLADLVARGKQVVDVSMPDDLRWIDRGERIRAAAAATEQAIRDGPDVIFQACLFDGTWLGFADFLVRTDGGTYEVVDTKLARTVKANAVLQMCSYTEHLTRIQGRQPELMHVALGGSAREVKELRVADYMAYYRTIKRLFLEAVNRPEPPAYPPVSTYPEPVEHCEICRWAAICAPRRRADDHVSLVAGIASRTRKELREKRSLTTRRQLAVLPLDTKLERTSQEALARVRDQARLQVAGEDAGTILHELIDPPPTLENGELDPGKGLLALPEPRPTDLFLDLEGDPFALDDGVDYLFGLLEPGLLDADGQPTFHRFWSRDADGAVTWPAEKRAFEQTIDLIMDRLEQDPALHVYHYATYERTAFGRLMGRHRTREVEVDRLFRGGVLVDLYRAVQQGVRASVESYSIKRLEPLYGYEREVDLRDAGSSIVAFETWLEVGGESGAEPDILERIERYNRDDVVSTWHLRDWLEERRHDLEVRLGRLLPRSAPAGGEADTELADWLRQVDEVAKPLAAGVPEKEADRTSGEHARWLLAQLLGWHRRENKASYWRYFRLRDAYTDEERVDEPEPIGMIELNEVADEEKRIYRYRFPPQDFKLDPDRVKDPEPGTWASIEVLELNDERQELVIRHRKSKNPIHHPRSLIPSVPPDTEKQEQSLLMIGRSVLANGIDGDGPYRAARDLLMRKHPRTGQGEGAPLRIAWEPTVDAAKRLALELRHTSLPIQGPPGSGKTWTGARMILDLVAAGKRVGVTANGHKVIGNLLDAVWDAIPRDGPSVRIGQKPGGKEDPTCRHAIGYKENEDVRDALADRSVDVVGGTAWLWSREEMQSSVDVLVIDEAGQFSLANAIAVSPAAESMILLGDPQQLDQPTQGSHPPGAERSALAHILADESVMPEERGLFLERTWRLHPEIATFTSETFYRGELEPEPGNERQSLAGAAELDGVGIRWVPIAHDRNTTSSVEEARWVAEQVRALLDSGATWTDREGAEHRLALDDVLIVTPWNAHRTSLERAFREVGLPAARIGTVDKFQGQQAPISIYSMATSIPEEAPRGLEFLYSLNRLNVATSRAQCLTVVVASPDLVRVRCTTQRQMQLANALCRLVEVAGSAPGKPEISRPEYAQDAQHSGAA